MQKEVPRMILFQLRAGRFRMTLEHIDRRKKPATPKCDRNKKTAQAVAAAQTVNVEVTNVIQN